MRARTFIANFFPAAAGFSGDGSHVPIGTMWLVDASSMSTVAMLDTANGAGDVQRDLAPPVAFGQPYYLFVQRPVGGAVVDDFYFVAHYAGWSNPLETADATNDAPATAEPLSITDNMDGTFAAYVEGDILGAGSATPDSDAFAVKVPPGLANGKVQVSCSSQRYGSGLRQFTFQLLRGSAGNAAIPNTVTVEGPLAFAYIPSTTIPAGETTLVLQVSAMAQDPGVTSTFYRCGVHFN